MHRTFLAAATQVYQYNMYCNYESQILAAKNPEIPDDD